MEKFKKYIPYILIALYFSYIIRITEYTKKTTSLNYLINTIGEIPEFIAKGFLAVIILFVLSFSIHYYIWKVGESDEK